MSGGLVGIGPQGDNSRAHRARIVRWSTSRQPSCSSLDRSKTLSRSCASYIGAAKTHLARLDDVQGRAEKLTGCISFQPLANRRDAACFGLLCKILDGNCVEPLLNMCPNFGLDVSALDLHGHNTRFKQAQEGSIGLVRVTNMRDTLRDKSLLSFERSFICRAYDIFNMIPNGLKIDGLKESWSHIMKDGQRYLSSR
jgi:hypothetical protein